MFKEKTPIVSPRSKPEEAKEFRQKKMLLKEANYPLEESRIFVQHYLDNISNKIVNVFDKHTVIVQVPSGSGTNKLTILLANEISKRYGSVVVPSNAVRKLNQGEAKLNLSLKKRNENPIRYSIDKNELIKYKGQKIIIIDDLIGSGESLVRLKKTLESNGIGVNSLFALVTVEKSYPKEIDFHRLAMKVDNYLKLNFTDKEDLRRNLMTVFSDYTKQKLNRVEREIRNESSAKRAFFNIKEAASIEKSFNRDIEITL